MLFALLSIYRVCLYENLKVSVVVPVYNQELKVSGCLCILNQTMKDLEIFSVDDGSSDNSLGILLEFSCHDTKVVVKHQENCGVSCARNAGLAVAKGEYVTFVDSDDWIELNGYKIAYNAGQENSVDAVFFGLMHGNVCVPPSRAEILQGTEAAAEFIPSTVNILSCWNKLYRTRFLRNNRVSFNVKLRNLEDYVFNFNLFCNIKSIYCVQECFYNYSPMSSGLSHTFKMKDLSVFYHVITEDLKKVKDSRECSDNLSEEHVRIVEEFGKELIKKERQRVEKD